MIAWPVHSAKRLRPHSRLTFAVTLGLSDGIISALTLASDRVLHGTGLHASLAVRVGVVAFA